MKRFLVLTAAVLTLSLLAGCMPWIAVTSPRDEEFRAAWAESMDEIEKDRREDPEDDGDDEEDGSWSAWAEAWEDWSGEVEERFGGMDRKRHVWKILDAGGQEAGTVEDEEAVELLDDLLSIHGDKEWGHLEEMPEDPACSYVYSQEQTLLAGQDPGAGREYEDLLIFSVSASEDVVTLQILGGLEELSLLPGLPMEEILTFSFSVPAETAEALRDPVRFSG